MTGWVRWFPSDWRGSARVALLEAGERCLYRELLDLQADAGPFEWDARRIARLVHLDQSDVEAWWPAVRPFFEQDDDGRWFNAKMLAETDRSEEQTEMARKAGRASAAARAKKRRKSTPVPTDVPTPVATVVPTNVPTTPTPTPTPIQTPTQSPEREARKRAKALYERPPFDLYGLDDPRIQDAWSRWIQCAKRRKAGPYTETGLKRILTKLGELGPAKALACIEYSETGGYPGLYFDRDFSAGRGQQNGRIPTGMDAVAAYMARKQQHGDDSRGPRLLG